MPFGDPNVLPERIFAIGGWLSIVAGGLFLATFITDPVPPLWGVIPTGVFLVGFGAFFLYVGKGAQQDRRRLLQSLEPPH